MQVDDLSKSFLSSIVRIYTTNGVVVGAGFLISNQHVITCAHVITQAMGIPQNTPDIPPGSVIIDFPLVEPGRKITAEVIFWRAVQTTQAISLKDGEDIAGLKIEGSSLDKNHRVKLLSSPDLWNHEVRVFGFPSGHDNGVHATGVLRGKLSNEWIQIEDIKVPGYRIEPGFSGSPVWDESLKGVVGMVVAAEKRREEVKSAFMVPASILSRAWDEVDVVSQELLTKLEKYSPKAEGLIFNSYSRSGDINQHCKKMLSIARETLDLSEEDTAIIEFEILSLCQNSYQKVKNNVRLSTEEIVNFFVKTSFEKELQFNRYKMHDMLEQLQLALGLGAEIAAETFSLSICTYGNELLSVDPATAVLVFQQALSYNRSSIEAHIGLGSAFFQRSQFVKALKAFQQAKKIFLLHKGSTDEDINYINNLIKEAKRMYWQEIRIKTLRILFPIPITSILRRICSYLRLP